MIPSHPTARTPHRPRPSAPAAPPGYRVLLAPAGVRPFMLATTVGRLSFGSAGVAILLAVQGATGSAAMAGAGVAAFAATAAVLAPVRARWIRRGHRGARVVLLACGFAAALGVLAGFVAQPGTSPATLIGWCAVAGSLPPPLGPETRATWAARLSRPGLVRRAYGLDATVDEVLFVLGPLVAAALVATAGPTAGLLGTAVLAVVGTGATAASSVFRAAAPSSAPVRGTRPRPLRVPGFPRLLLVLFGVGAGLGGLELAAVAAAGPDAPAGAGVLVATVAVGGVVGGVHYGRRSWRRAAPDHVVVLGAALTGSVLAAAATTAVLPLLAVALFVGGLVLSPLLIAGYTMADDLVAPADRVEAGALVNAGNNLGASAGTATAALVFDHAGLPVALLVIAAGTACATLLAAARVTAGRGQR